MVNEFIPTIDSSIVCDQALIVAGITFILGCVAEFIHAKRIRRNAYLLFGPKGNVPVLIPLAALMRISGITLLLFGFYVLAQWYGVFEPRVGADSPKQIQYPHRVIVAYDVSPSMYFAQDAGPNKNQLRRDRAKDVYQSVVERLSGENCLYSLLLFWSDVKPLVIDTFDIAILDNAFNGLPLPYAMKSGGKTELATVMKYICDMAKDWHDNSATLIFITDGDVLPEKGLPTLPPAYGNVLVFGIGDATKGAYIDDHFSRQSRTNLNDLANRYSGVYFNANELYPSSDFFANMKAIEGQDDLDGISVRTVAKIAIILGALLFLIPSILLTYAATKWMNLTRRSDG